MSLQIETGKYTRIVNEVLEQLVKGCLLGSEYQVVLFVIRKTWGYNKKEDVISFSQFILGTGLSRETINKTLKNLVLKKILVKRCGLGKQQISYKFNKYWKEWLVNPHGLVKSNAKTSQLNIEKLVKAGRHTKDNTKDKQKKEIFNLDTNPSYKELKAKFGRTQTSKEN